jgi:hypothetical protein
VRVVIRDWRASGAFWMRGSGRNGRGSGRNGRSSGRRWSVIGFEDNVLMAWNWAPFIEYNVTRLEKFACGSVNEVKRTALLGESKEHAGQQVGRQLVVCLLRDVDMSNAAKNMEL